MYDPSLDFCLIFALPWFHRASCACKAKASVCSSGGRTDTKVTDRHKKSDQNDFKKETGRTRQLSLAVAFFHLYRDDLTTTIFFLSSSHQHQDATIASCYFFAVWKVSKAKHTNTHTQTQTHTHKIYYKTTQQVVVVCVLLDLFNKEILLFCCNWQVLLP
jgi:hypothetical protein